MDQTLIFWTIVGMAVVTYLPRLLPTLFLSGRNLQPFIASGCDWYPQRFWRRCLSLRFWSGRIRSILGFDNLFFWAALIAFFVAWKWNSLFATVVIGMGLVALGRYFGLGM